MREPKYRAWLGSEMVQVVTLNTIKNSTGLYDEYSKGYFLNGENKGRHTSFDLNSASLRQFTGLHDKNGKEIYEGDLVLNHRNTHSKEVLQVKWQEAESKQADGGIWWTHKKPGFIFERINPGMHTVYVAEKDFEVIGNIFENKDLLS